MDATENTKNQGIQVISRAADILRLLGRETGGLSLGQIASEVELPRSTVQRIVSALTEEGFIANQNGNGTIRLGPEIQNLAQANTTSLRVRLRPVMESLSEDTGETVDLAILEGSHMRFVDQIEGSQRLRTVSRIGDLFPLTTTANGKAALACLERAQAIQLIKTELGISGDNSKLLKRLLNELDAIAAGELAVDDNEHTDGICALGYAIKSKKGNILALSIPVPGSRFQRIKLKLSRSFRNHLKEIKP